MMPATANTNPPSWPSVCLKPWGATGKMCTLSDKQFTFLSINYPSRNPLPALQYHGPADTSPEWNKSILVIQCLKNWIKSAEGREEGRQRHYQIPRSPLHEPAKKDAQMTPANKQFLGLLRKVPAKMKWGQIPSSASLTVSISRDPSKAIMAMQSLEGLEKYMYSSLRKDQTYSYHWWQFTQAVLTSLQQEALNNLPVDTSVLNLSYIGYFLYHKSSQLLLTISPVDTEQSFIPLFITVFKKTGKGCCSFLFFPYWTKTMASNVGSRSCPPGFHHFYSSQSAFSAPANKWYRATPRH